MKVSDFWQWCIQQHAATNHMYDRYLPYEMHLRMVHMNFEKWSHLLPKNMYVRDLIGRHDDVTLEVIHDACWGHDLIEDARVSYSDIVKRRGVDVAEIIYALTNPKGRNRKERNSDEYYLGIVKTPGAVFCKLCDRLANAQYSSMMGSRQFSMYQEEHYQFKRYLQPVVIDSLLPMWDDLESVLKLNQPAV